MKETSHKELTKKLGVEVVEYLEQVEKGISHHSLLSVTDLTGRGTILRVNDLFCEVSGYSREELLGKEHNLLNSGHHPKEFFASIYSGTARQGDVVSLLIKNMNKMGGIYWVQSTFTGLFDKTGSRVGILSLRHEVTELVENTELLKEKEKQLEEELAKSKEVNIELQKGENWYKIAHKLIYLIGFIFTILALVSLVAEPDNAFQQLVLIGTAIVSFSGGYITGQTNKDKK